jgi:mannose-1-phosphate guanylyltransferase
MLLAAGFGTRLRPYTLLRPKPLFPVCNVPLLHLLLDKLVQAGCERAVVNCHHLADQIIAAAADRPEVILQHETEVLGTGGGLRKALEHFTEKAVLVMNGDLWHDIDLQGLMAAHKQGNFAVTMALHDHPRFNSVHVSGSAVSGFGPNGKLAFTGIHVVSRAVIEQIPAVGFFHIIDLYAKLAQAGQIGFVRVDGCFWQDIGTPADYLDLHRRLLAGKEKSWIISSQAKIGSDVALEDWGVIGPGAIIGSGTRLSRCVIWEDAVIAPGLWLTDQIVCSDEVNRIKIKV